MSNGINQYTEHLQQRREDPVRGIIAATALGRESTLLRSELEGPAVRLGPGDSDNAISALTLTLWDMKVLPTQRAAAAWALGQIGGLEPTRKLLNRLEILFVQRRARVLGPTDQAEVSEVHATLVEALARAADAPTMQRLNQHDRGQLRRICNALLDYMRTSQESDPDLSTSLAMSLAKLALRARTDLPDILHELLNMLEPMPTLAAIGALSELLPAEQGGDLSEVSQYDAFRELEARRGRPYELEERYRLLELADQLWYAEQDTRLAGDLLWKKIQQALAGTNLT